MRSLRSVLSRRVRVALGDESGFSLLEAVVALVIAAVIFTGLAAVSISAVHASLLGRQNQQAGDLIGKRIEQLRVLDIQAVANVDADMVSSTDTRIQNCGGAKCVDPGTGTTENLVLDDAGAVAPHLSTVASSATNNTTFQIASYVTLPAGQDPDYQRRITVFVTWKDANGTHTRSDSTIVSYGVRGLPLPKFKLTPQGPTTQSTNPSTRVYYGFTLMNQGAPDHWDISFTDSGGAAWTLVFDADDDGTFTSADSDPTTWVPLTDTTANGVVDTGLLEPGASTLIWAFRDVPASASLTPSDLVITATSTGQPTAEGAAASLTFTTTVVNGVITPSPTTSPTAPAASDCLAPAPLPAAAATTGYSLRSYTLHNDVSAGDTVVLPQMVMNSAGPYASTLPRYSTDIASSATGRVVWPGGGSSTDVSGRAQYADWYMQVSNGGRSYSGTATLTYWVATTGAVPTTVTMTAYVYQYAKGAGGAYGRVPVTSAVISINPFNCLGFQQVSVAIPLTSTVKNDDYIGVRLVNNGSANVRLAYDVAGAYPAALVLPEK